MNRMPTPQTRTTPRRTARMRAAVVAAGAALASLVAAAGTPALAAPPSTLEMSSFVAEVSGHDVVGGVRTVTVTNPGDQTVDASVSLGAAPCDCVVDSAIPSRGTRVGDSWDVGDLGPGETATLTMTYVAAPQGAAVPDAGGNGRSPWSPTLAGMAVIAGAATVVASAGYAPILRWRRHRGTAVA